MGHFICFLDSLNIDVFRHAEKLYLVIFTKCNLSDSLKKFFETPHEMHTSLNGEKDARHLKSKQTFRTQNLKSVVNVHPNDQEKMKAEILDFHLVYVSLGTEVHEF